MLRKALVFSAVLAMILGLAFSAQAYTINFTNDTLMQTWYLHGATSDPLTGSIGGDPYRLNDSSVTWSGSDVAIHEFGKYPIAGTAESGVADLFFLNPADLTVKYGLYMSGTNMGKLVSNVTVNTSEFYFGSNSGYKYGGQFWDGVQLRAGMATIASGTDTGITATISETVTGGVHDWSILLEGVNVGGDWNELAYYIATGQCNNSGQLVPYAQVPLPAAFWLVGSGLAGLGLLRKKSWRRKTATT